MRAGTAPEELEPELLLELLDEMDNVAREACKMGVANRIAALRALSGLRSGTRLVAPVSVAPPGGFPDKALRTYPGYHTAPAGLPLAAHLCRLIPPPRYDVIRTLAAVRQRLFRYRRNEHAKDGIEAVLMHDANIGEIGCRQSQSPAR